MTADMEERIRNEVGDWIALRAMNSEIGTRIALGDTLSLSLGRVLVGIALRAGSSTAAFDSVSEDQVRHICDWLSAAIGRGERWLSRVDDQGRPLKLMKFGAVSQILDEADKAMAKRRGDAVTLKPEAGGTKVIYDAGDGWTLVRLMTPEALDIEGREMGHCVGQGAYDYGLANNFIGIYSLRDPMGKSHVTLEINHPMDKVQQIKGKQNKPPKAEYMRRLLGWNGLMELAVAASELPPGFAIDDKRGIVELSSLTNGDVFNGKIAVELIEGQADYVLPLEAGVVVRGDVSITGRRGGRLVGGGSNVSMVYPTVTIPDGVWIDGVLRLDHVTMNSFSVNATKFAVRNSTIRSIGGITSQSAEFSNSNFDKYALDGASFSGRLNLKSSPGVVFHPSTKVSLSVIVSGCRPMMNEPESPVEFRSGFVANWLEVWNSLVSFGDQSYVAGSLEIRRSTVKKMPINLSVSGGVRIKESIIDRWPDVMTAGEELVEDQVVVLESTPDVERPRWVTPLFSY
jgi:hypothetical protein